MNNIIKRIVKILLVLILFIVAAAACAVGYLSVTAYNPAQTEALEIIGEAALLPSVNEDITLLTFNTGYAALDKDNDFFMDGGSGVLGISEEKVNENIAAVENILKEASPQIVFLQEVDTSSKRSFYINEAEHYFSSFNGCGAFAYNYKCNFVPYPLPPMGKTNSGIMTLSVYNVEEAARESLPVPFKWPVSTCNLKRCLLEERINIEGSDKQLILINLHLEAYDNGEGKEAQTKILLDIIKEEYAKGNYVIAGGDFNQTFPGVDKEKYPLLSDSVWNAGTLEENILPDGWRFVFDDTFPTCRLLNAPYDKDAERNQYYVIDGFIVSPNIEVKSAEVINKDFVNSDHNPVKMVFCLKEEK